MSASYRAPTKAAVPRSSGRCPMWRYPLGDEAWDIKKASDPRRHRDVRLRTPADPSARAPAPGRPVAVGPRREGGPYRRAPCPAQQGPRGGTYRRRGGALRSVRRGVRPGAPRAAPAQRGMTAGVSAEMTVEAEAEAAAKAELGA